MKTSKNALFIFFLAFLGCRNTDNTLRHLIRPSTSLIQNSKNESFNDSNIQMEYKIIEIKTNPDSNGFKRFEVRVLLPNDTSYFKQFSSFYIADSLNLKIYPKSLVKALYLNSDSSSFKTIYWMYSQNPKKGTGVDVIQNH